MVSNVLKSHVWKTEDVYFIDGIAGYTSAIDDCNKDNIIQFISNNRAKFDFGEIKCQDNEARFTELDYVFDDTKDKLIISGLEYKLCSISSQKLLLLLENYTPPGWSQAYNIYFQYNSVN